MTLFLDILTKVTLPIITLVVLGYTLQSRLKLDIGTLNRVQVYVVMPAFLVHFLATAKIPLSAIWPVLGAGFLLLWIAVSPGIYPTHVLPTLCLIPILAAPFDITEHRIGIGNTHVGFHSSSSLN